MDEEQRIHQQLLDTLPFQLFHDNVQKQQQLQVHGKFDVIETVI